MRAWRRYCAAVVLLNAGWTLPALAQSSLAGIVRADSAGRPLGGVEVLLEGTEQITTTDQSGRYRLAGIPSGNRIVLFRLLGYRPFRIQLQLIEGDTTHHDVWLVRQSTQVLDPVHVEGRAAGSLGIGREAFEERRARGFGRFIDTEELCRSENRTVSGLLRGLQGVNIIRFRECSGSPVRCGRTEERAASGRGETSMSRGMTPPRDDRRNTDYCWMSIMLDGQWVYQSGSNTPVPDLSRDIRVRELDLVEVYRSAAETPGQFSGSGTACGVIIFWTNRGR